MSPRFQQGCRFGFWVFFIRRRYSTRAHLEGEDVPYGAVGLFFIRINQSYACSKRADKGKMAAHSRSEAERRVPENSSLSFRCSDSVFECWDGFLVILVFPKVVTSWSCTIESYASLAVTSSKLACALPDAPPTAQALAGRSQLFEVWEN